MDLYQSMSTEELQAVLPAIEDTEEILYICRILASRRKEPRNVERAWQEFIEHYCPEECKAGLIAAHEKRTAE